MFLYAYRFSQSSCAEQTDTNLKSVILHQPGEIHGIQILGYKQSQPAGPQHFMSGNKLPQKGRQN